MADTTEKKKAAPYAPFATFQNALDNVAQHSVPNIIDRSSFPSFSGGMVAATLSAFRFFGLIDEEGKPSQLLHNVAMEKENRKVNIRTLLENHYPDLIALDLSRATPSQFDNVFSTERYGVSGDTRTKSKIFFLKAAQFAEIPISKLLLNKSRASAPRKPRKGNANGKQEFTSQATPTINPAPSGTQHSKQIALSGGGTLTLALSVNLWDLKGKDRDFVFALMDKIEAYETPAEPSAAEGVTP